MVLFVDIKCVEDIVGGFFFFFQAEDGIRDRNVTGVQTCAISLTITRRDTATHNLTLKLYRLPVTIDSTTTFADVESAFADTLRAVNVDALLAKPGGVDSATGDQAAIDTTSKFLKVTLKLDSRLVDTLYVPAHS